MKGIQGCDLINTIHAFDWQLNLDFKSTNRERAIACLEVTRLYIKYLQSVNRIILSTTHLTLVMSA
jgi:hypothetical protein